MKEKSVRTTVDIPGPLYRKLKQPATAKGRSIRELVLAGVKSMLVEGQRPCPRTVGFPLVVSSGPKVELANELIYVHVEFPCCERVAGSFDRHVLSERARLSFKPASEWQFFF